MARKDRKNGRAKIVEYRSLLQAEHDPGIIWDDDEAYEDYIKNGKTIEELMKEYPPAQPIDIHEWSKDDFKEYYEGLADGMGEDAAWSFLYAKILERAGEGDGGVSPDELFGKDWDLEFR